MEMLVKVESWDDFCVSVVALLKLTFERLQTEVASSHPDAPCWLLNLLGLLILDLC